MKQHLLVHSALCAALLSLFSCHPPRNTSSAIVSGEYQKTASGVLVLPKHGEAKAVQLQVYNDQIIRVTSSADNSIEPPKSIMVTATPTATAFTVNRENNWVTLTTDAMTARVSLENGEIHFSNAFGETLDTLGSGHFGQITSEVDSSGQNHYAIAQSFRSQPDDAYYGLGQQQNGKVNLAGENVYLTTYNLIITIPYLTSSKKFGILWDNNADSRFGTPLPPQPLYKNFDLYTANGQPGALTARYYDGDTLLLERDEKDLDYQFLRHNSVREIPLPPETDKAKDLRIEWAGSLASKTDGDYELLMYSSGQASLTLDQQPLLNRWRMGWNPWYHTAKVAFAAGEKRKIQLEWRPQGGYMHLLSHAPSPESRRERITFSSEVATLIDYYVVAGSDYDALISGYRQLTGKSVLLPRWAYGFWQSRERYKSSEEIVAAVEGYRQRKIPLDNIVLDWSYWPEDAWGSHDFDPNFFPDPKALVDKVHALDAHIMISVWPKFYPTTDNYRALNSHGYMLNRNIEDGNKDWIEPGYPNAFYDAFNPEARNLYWQQLDEKINRFGFDAWWLDAAEPDMHSNVNWQKRKDFLTPNFRGTGAEVFNAYAVPHAEGVYQGDRASAPDTRVFILTRSGFGGIQRTASAIWSGDTVSRWSNLKEQIAAGINTGMAGMANWTLDIGGFTPEDRFRLNKGAFVGDYRDMDPAQLPEWQELNTRWFQFGAFLPLYRSHGQNPYREIFNIAAEGTPAYQSMVWYTKLRYRLLPYIYSLAGDVYHKDGILMRGLAMDFPQDQQAANVSDQYLLGPSFLVAPVYEFHARQREVYLPSGSNWYDFYSGKFYPGGQTLQAAAPYQRMPLYVKAGTILVTGPEAQYAEQTANSDLTLTVFTGADGNFELYEDDGNSYDYEQGAWSRIPMHYDSATGVLTLGRRLGRFEGMATQRTINIRWVDGEKNYNPDFAENIVDRHSYKGEKLTIHHPGR